MSATFEPARERALAEPRWLAEGLWLVGGPGLSGQLDALAYLIACGDGQAVLVDCGTNAPALLRNAAAAGFAPDAIAGVLATHGHLDHLAAAPALIDAGCGGVWLHEAEAAAVRTADPVATCAYLYGRPATPVPVAHELVGGGLLRFGTRTIEVVETPGHSPGSVSYLIDCGDTRVALLGDRCGADSTRGSAPISTCGDTPLRTCRTSNATRCPSGTDHRGSSPRIRRRSRTPEAASAFSATRGTCPRAAPTRGCPSARACPVAALLDRG